MVKPIHYDSQVIDAIKDTPSCFRAAADKLAAANETSDVLDALLDTLGLCIIVLGAFDRSQLLNTVASYCNGQMERGRDPNSIHNQTLRTVVAVVVASASREARVANVKTVFAGRAKKGL